MSRSQISNYLVELQNIIQAEVKKGASIDSFLERSTIFDEFEKILPPEEFGIFILTILNNFRDKSIFPTVLDMIENSKQNLSNKKAI